MIIRSTRNLEREYPKGIPACGTDSLRFALIAYTQQVKIDNNILGFLYFLKK